MEMPMLLCTLFVLCWFDICHAAEPPAAPVDLKIGDGGSNQCPSGYTLVMDVNKCKQEVSTWSGKVFDSIGCYLFKGHGCFYGENGNKIYYNNCNTKDTHLTHHPVCEVDLKIGDGGSNQCPSGYTLVMDVNKCKQEVSTWSGKVFGSIGCYLFKGHGCFYGENGNKIYYNNCNTKDTHLTHHPVCEKRAKRKDQDRTGTEEFMAIQKEFMEYEWDVKV